jgi:subtilisin family serine protease
MNFYKFIISILFMTFCVSSFGQKLSHRQGEIIVHVSTPKALNQIVQKYTQYNNRATRISTTPLLVEPQLLYIIKVDWTQVNENQLLDDLRLDSNVLSAQKNSLISPRKTPNDPRFSNQWQYINNGSTGGIGNDLDMDEAWEFATGGVTAQGDTIVVAVIDGGFDQTHEDLAGNVWKNNNEIPDNGIDDDANGYIDDYLGWSVTKQTDEFDKGSHGLAVCGIVGAVGNNNIGVSGMNWKVKVMHIEYGTGTEANALASYGYAYKMRKLYNETNGLKGAFIVATNASWGINEGKAEDAPIWCEFYNTLGDVGIINCGATANSNLDVEVSGDLPTACTSDYLISVTNLNSSDLKVNAAAYGSRSIDLGAYGEGTYTIAGSNNYGTFGGTSGATPHVTGLAALIYATSCNEFINFCKSNPALGALAVKDFVLNGVKPLNILNDLTTARGKLNGKNTMQQVASLCQNTSAPYAIQIERISNNQMKASWFGGENTTNDLRYRTAGQGSWTTISNISNPYFINNLPLCADYEFQLKSSFTNTWGYSRFVKTGGCCVLPTDIIIGTINNAITVNFNGDFNSSSTIIEYKKAGDNDWTVETIDTDNFESSFLSYCSTYEVRLKSDCNSTSNQSNYSATYLVNTDCDQCSETLYCVLAPKNNDYEWIESVTIDGITNTSGRNSLAYGFYSNFFQNDLDYGSTHNISLTPGYIGTTYPEYFKVYIDFNQNGTFENTNEIVFDAGATTKVQIDGQFSIPNGVMTGYTRMRVIMSYQGPANACEPNNGNYEDGEYEDYCVFISNGQCDRINSLSVDDTKIDGFDLSWSSTSANSYQINIKNVETGTIQSITSNDNQIEINGLLECSAYSITITSFCNSTPAGMSDVYYLMTKCGSFVDNTNNEIGGLEQAYFSYDYLKVKYQLATSEELQTNVYDINGRLIQSDKSTWDSGKSLKLINMSNDIQSGLYVITVSGKQVKKSLKVIKY